MDKEITIPKKEIAPGIYSTGGIATIPTNNPLTGTPNVIPAQNLGPVAPFNVASTLPEQTPPATPSNPPALLPDAPVQTEAENLSTTLASLIGESSGKAVDTLNVENQADVVSKRNESNRLADLYKTKSAEYDSLVTGLENAPRGAGNQDIRASMLFGQQGAVLRQKATDLERINADYLVSVGQYDRAKEAQQRIVDLKYAPIEEQIKIKEAQLLAIQPLLTKAEKKQAEARTLALEKEKTALKDAKENEIAIEKMNLDARALGAPNDVLERASKAKTKTEAAQMLGTYYRDLDMEIKKSQIAKNWADAKKNDTTDGVLTEQQLKQIDSSPQGKKLVSLSGLYQKSQTYKNLLDTYGFQAVGPEKAKLDQAYADLKIAYKEAANLGALTGPDVTLLEEAIKPASGATNLLNYKLSGGKKGVSGAIDGALSKARAEALQNFKQLIARKPEYRGSEYVTSLITPFATDYSKADIDNMGAGEIIQTEDGILLESLGNGQFTPL